MSDVINLIAGLEPKHPLAVARQGRPAAVRNAQASFEALLEPLNPGTFSYRERYAVATYVAGISQVASARDFYAELLLDDAPATLREAIVEAVEQASSAGPYGNYREAQLQRENDPHGFITHDVQVFGQRLAAAFDVAHLFVFHPRDARAEAIGHLYAAGWNSDEIVSLAQLISFLSFQLRVIHGLSVIAGAGYELPATDVAEGTTVSWPLGPATEYPQLRHPERFVRHSLGWHPWVEGVAKEDLNAEQLDALIEPARANMPYFRMLARDPAALKARTLTDFDIFYNVDGGLSRAEREWAATVTSRLNGCVYCASVHAARAIEEGGSAAEVDLLLDQGVGAAASAEVNPRWAALAQASKALTVTPLSYGPETVAALRAVGLDEAELLDHLNATAFFNWANRLMLGLGEPELPARYA